jgi:hypothetical protein
MGELPEHLDRETHIDPAPRGVETWLRRGALLALLGFTAAGLANIFGQRASETTAVAPAATLTVEAPGALRGGLVWQGLFRVVALRRLEKPALVFDPGWFDGMTLNSIEPDAAEQSSRGGRSVFTFDPLPAGEQLVVRLQFQVNPTALGRRSQTVALEDGDELLVDVVRSVFVYP